MKTARGVFHVVTLSLLTVAVVLATNEPAQAQLIDGPWPMFRHDVCHTGQSPNAGHPSAATGEPSTSAWASTSVPSTPIP